MTQTTCALENEQIRLAFMEENGQVNGYTLDVRKDGQWLRMGEQSPLSKVVYQDTQGSRQEMAILAQIESAPSGIANLQIDG